ncbi:MAG: glycosyltransferase family 39 protein [Anaerolineae bacterium]|nr:glycosyltransferase family 39 protein [Anaerolineae bacterium]
MASRRLYFALFMALVWLFLVVALYYVPHKPFSPSNLKALGKALSALAGGLATLALGTGLGLLTTKFFPFEPAQRMVWSAALGMGLLSSGSMALGAVGLLRPTVVWPLTLLGLAATGPELVRALRKFKFPEPQNRFERFLAFYIFLSLGLSLLQALTPPSAWDSLVYHLTGPKFYLKEGKISHPLDLPYLGFPQLTEMLFTWAMALAGERTAAVIHWSYGLLAAFIGLGFSESPYLVGALVLSAPTVFILTSWPYVDIALLVYVTLTFQALEFYRERRSLRWLVLAGAMAGFALSVKYTAVAVLVAASFLLFIVNRRRECLLFPLIAFLLFSPWLIKNLALTGNPFYPFFLKGVYWDEYRRWWFGRPWTGFATTAPFKLVTALWDATIWGVEGLKGYQASLGPLFLGLFPLLAGWKLVSQRERLIVRDALIFFSILYAFWLLGLAWSQLLVQGRLLLPAFGVLAIALSVGVRALEALPPRPVNLGWVFRAAIVLVLVFNLVEFSLGTIEVSPLRVIVGFEREEDFLARRLGWYIKAIEFINQDLPPGARVLFLWEPRSYHCQRDCLPDSILDRFSHSLYLHGYDAEALISAWRREGVTHLLLHRAGLNYIVEEGFDPIGPGELEVLGEVLRFCRKVKDFGGAYQLFELPEASSHFLFEE